jgi:hypothetical protein
MNETLSHILGLLVITSPITLLALVFWLCTRGEVKYND